MDNLYGDEEVKRTVSNRIIDIDLDVAGNSLLKCIRQISSVIDTQPEDDEITIYFVCSTENSFFSELLKYIENLPNTNRLKLIFRGKFPFKDLPLIFNTGSEIIINEKCIFNFTKETVYEYISNCKRTKRNLDTFLSRFDVYFQFNSDLDINVDELIKLGYEFKKF